MQESLVAPHGGVLINRLVSAHEVAEKLAYARTLLSYALSEELTMDVDKIAIGAYSPIEGFFMKSDFDAVVNTMHLVNGIVWTLPIVLDVSKEMADALVLPQDIALLAPHNTTPFAILHVEEVYPFDQAATALKIFKTNDHKHPGVAKMMAMHPFLVGGKIDVIQRPPFAFSKYEKTPMETRQFFSERGHSRVVGFHTRNAIHRAHEYLQRSALEAVDGLLIQPVVGKKKSGDFTAGAIVASYEAMAEYYYPQDRVLFSVVSTCSRYAGPREAVFTALLRKNYGCSHFIVGRDHTGVGSYYDLYASHKIFEEFGETLGMTILFFREPLWCQHCGHITTEKTCIHETEYKKISGTLIRSLLTSGEDIPVEFMRPEISSALKEFSKTSELFVE